MVIQPTTSRNHEEWFGKMPRYIEWPYIGVSQHGTSTESSKLLVILVETKSWGIPFTFFLNTQ
jgi:hypothetical protein